jgi:hypothetical protein
MLTVAQPSALPAVWNELPSPRLVVLLLLPPLPLTLLPPVWLRRPPGVLSDVHIVSCGTVNVESSGLASLPLLPTHGASGQRSIDCWAAGIVRVTLLLPTSCPTTLLPR